MGNSIDVLKPEQAYGHKQPPLLHDPRIPASIPDTLHFSEMYKEVFGVSE